jgi:hypothetical protein
MKIFFMLLVREMLTQGNSVFGSLSKAVKSIPNVEMNLYGAGKPTRTISTFPAAQ